MSSVITGIYRMKKRRSSAVDGAIASTSTASSSSKVDANAFRPTAYCVASASAQRQHKFLTCDSLLVTKKAEISPRTPRRSPRIHGAISRTSRFGGGFDQSAQQDSPESQEPLITWKCNSPVYVKSLKPISACDLREVVRQFVPITKPARKEPGKPSLLDLWHAPCELPLVIPLAKTEPVQPKSEQREHAAKEQEELMEQESSIHAEPVQVPTADEEKDPSSSVVSAAISESNGNGTSGVWGDDALFEDENVIAATQQVELEALSHEANHCLKPISEQIPDRYEACSPDILDCATQLLLEEDSLLNRATQPVNDRSDDSWSHEFMDVAFVEDVSEYSALASAASKVEATEMEKTTAAKFCDQEEIQRKREEALRRRSARLRALQPQNNTLRVATQPSTSSPFAFKKTEQNRTFLRSNSFSGVNKVNDAVPLIQPIIISQGVPACSQSYTQRDIERKKEEALKRRSARLAAQSALVPNSEQQRVQVTATAMATALEEQRRLYSQDEIERKKKQAIEKRLMMMQKKKQQHQQQQQQQPQPQAQLTNQRHQRLVPSIN